MIDNEKFLSEKKILEEKTKWNTDFIQKFAVHEKYLLEIKKRKEVLNALLDYIDYGFEGKETYENTLNLATVSDVEQEISKCFPDLGDRMPTENVMDQVRNEKIKEYNELEGKEVFIFSDLKKEIINSIKNYNKEGFLVSETSINKYLNHADQVGIGNFEMKLIPLLKATDENDFNQLFDKMENIDKINFGSIALREMMINNDLYEQRNIIGYISNKIPEFIADFNKSTYFCAFNFLITNKKVSGLIVDNFDKFDRLLPDNASEKTLRRTAGYSITSLLEEGAECAAKGWDGQSIKYLNFVKKLNNIQNCDRIINDKIKLFANNENLKNTDFFKELNADFKRKIKNKIN